MHMFAGARNHAGNAMQVCRGEIEGRGAKQVCSRGRLGGSGQGWWDQNEGCQVHRETNHLGVWVGGLKIAQSGWGGGRKSSRVGFGERLGFLNIHSAKSGTG